MPALTDRVRVCVALFWAESVTWSVMLKFPAVVGVPEMVPVLEPSVKPLGNEPEVIPQVYGVAPPEAVTVAL